MPDSATGRVPLDAELESQTPPPPSWPVGRLLRLADEHLHLYDDLSVPYYHSLLAVHVRPPTAVGAESVYGIAGAGGIDGSGMRARDSCGRGTHAGEGLHHLVFFVNAASEEQHEQVVRQAATTALGEAISGAVSYTTFSVMRCNAFDSSVGCGSEAGFHELVRRSRWSAVLPGLQHFLYGTRGSVRSVLLSYEALLHGAGAVCAPQVRWQTALAQGATASGASGGGGGDGSGSSSGLVDGMVNSTGVQSEGNLEKASRETASAAVRRQLYEPWEETGRAKRRLFNEAQPRAEAGGAASGSGGATGGGQVACVRVPCNMEAEELHPCVMIQGLPLLGRKRAYLSGGEPLPEGDTSYRVPYKGPKAQRLEVAWLRAPTAVVGNGGEQEQAAVRCSPGPRPRLSVPWCGSY